VSNPGQSDVRIGSDSERGYSCSLQLQRSSRLLRDCSGPMGTSVRLSLMTAGSSMLKPLRGAEASRSGRT
jgi:hypothetical protein